MWYFLLGSSNTLLKCVKKIYLLILLSFYEQKNEVLKNRRGHSVDDFFVEDYSNNKNRKFRLSMSIAITRTINISFYAKITKWRMLKKKQRKTSFVYFQAKTV